MADVKKDIIKKLTKQQIFILCLVGFLWAGGIIVLLALLAPESLPTFISGIF